MNTVSSKIKIAEIFVDEVYSDVLERIEGYDCLTNDGIMELDGCPCEIHVYLTSVLKNIITNEDDDTNETTKERIIDLYKEISDCAYFMIIKMF